MSVEKIVLGYTAAACLIAIWLLVCELKDGDT